MSFLGPLLAQPLSLHLTPTHRPAHGTAHPHQPRPDMSSLTDLSGKGLPILGASAHLLPPWVSLHSYTSRRPSQEASHTICGLSKKPAYYVTTPADRCHVPVLWARHANQIPSSKQIRMPACLQSQVKPSLTHQYMLPSRYGRPCGPPRKSSFSLSYFEVGFHYRQPNEQCFRETCSQCSAKFPDSGAAADTLPQTASEATFPSLLCRPQGW